MKILMILPLTLVMFVSRLNKGKTDPFDYFSFSPLYLNGQTKLILKANRAFTFIVYITNDMYTERAILSGGPTKGGTYTYTYDNSYTRSTNKISISIKVGTKTTKSSKIAMNIESGKSEKIVDNKPITTDRGITTYNPDNTWSTRQITFNFLNFDGLYTPDYYHKIKVGDFAIKVAQADKPFFSCIPSLVVKNVNGVFNDVAKTSNVEFPLELYEFDEGYTFRLKDDLYVHMETLLLSKTSKPGYVKTKHIYLPRNEMRNQSKYKAYFAFTNFGIDKDTVTHQFEFRALRNIVGDCSNSMYCIQQEWL